MERINAISYEHSALKPPFNGVLAKALQHHCCFAARLDLVRGHVQGRNQFTAMWHRKKKKNYGNIATSTLRYPTFGKGQDISWSDLGRDILLLKRGKVDGKQVFSSSTVWPAFGDGIGFSGIHTPWSTLWKFTCAFDTHTAWCAYVPGSINSLYWKKGHPIFNRGTLYYVTLFWDWWPSPITWKQW